MINCKLAFSGANLVTTQEVMPCCGLDTSKFNYSNNGSSSLESKINSKGLIEIREKLLADEWHPACKLCEDATKGNYPSMMSGWNKTLEEFEPQYKSKIDLQNLREMSITLDSICNSRCMTCGPGASSQWMHEVIELDKTQELKAIVTTGYGEELEFGKENVDEFIEKCSNVRYLTLYGGEPTVSPNYEYLVDNLIESGRSKNINLSTTSNLTNISNKLIDKWKEFQSTHITLSIDGVGKTNEYIRYPFRWDKIDKNLNQILQRLQPTENVSIGLSTTVSLFNIVDCIDVVEYWYSTLHKNNWRHNVPTVNFNRVQNPSYVRPEILSKQFRERAFEHTARVRDKIEANYSHFITVDTFKNSTHIIESWASEEQQFSKTQIDNLRNLIHLTDKARNRDINDYLPQVYKEIKGLQYKDMIDTIAI